MKTTDFAFVTEVPSGRVSVYLKKDYPNNAIFNRLAYIDKMNTNSDGMPRTKVTFEVFANVPKMKHTYRKVKNVQYFDGWHEQLLFDEIVKSLSSSSWNTPE